MLEIPLEDRDIDLIKEYREILPGFNPKELARINEIRLIMLARLDSKLEVAETEKRINESC